MGLVILSEDNSTTAWMGSYTSFSRYRASVAEMVDGERACVAFFNHSDCDGEWTPAECREVIDLLTRLKEKQPDTDMETTTDQLLTGLQYCVQNNQNALFC